MLLVFVALSQPQWHTKLQHITIWVDNTKSMHTLESGKPRIEYGFSRLIKQLTSYKNYDIVIRSISSPHESLSIDITKSQTGAIRQLNDWAKNPSEKSSIPLAMFLNDDSEHWLLTDGADNNIAAWIKKFPFNKIIYIGNENENVSISRLTSRPSLILPGVSKVMVGITNHGARNAKRKLHFSIDGTDKTDRNISIPPDGINIQEYEIGRDFKGSLTASISPADALELDDKLTLRVSDKAAMIAVSDACPRHLLTTLSVLPWVQSTTNLKKPYDLFISCNDFKPANSSPQVIFHSGKKSHPVDGVPRWHNNTASMKDLFLDSSWLNAFLQTSAGAQGEVLLESQDMPLITLSGTNKDTIHVWIDLKTSSLRDRSEYPVLIAGLIEIALNRSLTERSIHAENVVSESMVAPREILPTRIHHSSAPKKSRRNLAYPFIILCILLLFIDLLIHNKSISWRS